MDQFNLRQKDVYNFDRFMDIKKPGFGPSDTIAYDAKKTPKQLAKWQNVVTRNKDFENGYFSPVYDGTWRAVSADRATRDAGIKQTVVGDYIDDLRTGRAMPTIKQFNAVKEGFSAGSSTDSWLKKQTSPDEKNEKEQYDLVEYIMHAQGHRISGRQWSREHLNQLPHEKLIRVANNIKKEVDDKEDIDKAKSAERYK